MLVEIIPKTYLFLLQPLISRIKTARKNKRIPKLLYGSKTKISEPYNNEIPEHIPSFEGKIINKEKRTMATQFNITVKNSIFWFIKSFGPNDRILFTFEIIRIRIAIEEIILKIILTFFEYTL